MSGAEPCTGSNIEGNVRSELMLAEAAKPKPALNGGSKVGEYVAEEIGSDDDVEALRRHHHARRHGVDVIARHLHIGILRGKFLGDFVPEDHRVLLRIGLGDATRACGGVQRACSKPKRRMRSTPVRVNIEVSTATSSVGALMNAAAGAGIFALGVFPDAEDVEASRS